MTRPPGRGPFSGTAAWLRKTGKKRRDAPARGAGVRDAQQNSAACRAA